MVPESNVACVCVVMAFIFIPTESRIVSCPTFSFTVHNKILIHEYINKFSSKEIQKLYSVLSDVLNYILLNVKRIRVHWEFLRANSCQD